MKRILASVLSLCLIVSMLNLSVWATEVPTGEEQGHKHCACSCVLTGTSCASHNADMVWEEWPHSDKLPTAAGNYYLSADIQLKGAEPEGMKISGATDVKLCLNGHSISLAKSDSSVSYRISVWDAASKLTIMDCRAQLDGAGQLEKGGIISGSSYGTNGAIYARGGELKLIGVQVSGNTNAEKTATYGGGAIQIRNGAKVTAEYAKFSNNTAGSDGGAICIKSGTLDAKNTTFAGNTAGISGGAIYLENNSCSAKLENCEVTGNTAAGAAIHVQGATATLEGVAITGNENIGTGGGGNALHTAAGGQATMKSCTVTGNKNTKVTDYAGAVYIPNANSKITVSGATVIDNNTVGGTAKEVNVYLQNSGTKLYIGALTEGSKIGVTTRDPANAADPNLFLGYIEAQDNATPVMAQETAQWIIYANKDANGEQNSAVGYNTTQRFYFTQNASHWHALCACGIEEASCTHTVTGWKAWESADSLPTTTGNYYLTQNVQLKGKEPDVKISGTADVKLCLNGYSISLAESDSDISYRISVWDATSKLTIMDCQAQLNANGQLEKGGTISGSSYGTNGAIYARGGELKLLGVQLSDNTNAEKTATYGGGAIQIRNGAKVTAQYVKFSGNTAGSDGGAICIKNGSLDAKNTVFTGNSAGISGGAIYLENNSCSVKLENCEVTGNTAAGAAIHVQGATATLESVTITGNENNGLGGGGSALHTAAGGKATLQNCTVTGNKNTKVTAYAGALYVPNANSSITVSGRTLIDNNTVGGTAKEVNVFLQNEGARLAVGQLAEGSVFGITTLTDYKLTDDPDIFMAKAAGFTTWNNRWVTYENISAAVDFSEENGFFFDTAGVHWHTGCVCAIVGAEADCAHGAEDKLTWKPWESTDSLPTTAGNYYLTGDVQLKGKEPDMRISGTADVRLCLNGYNISLAESDSDISYRISVWEAASKLTIMDCKAQLSGDGQLEKGGTISGSSYGTNGAIYARGGELTLLGVEVSGNANAEKAATFGGGAIQIRNGAKVTTQYVKLSDNTAGSDGGAICVKSGTLDAKNTVFTGNSAGISGGALYLENNSCSAVLIDCIFDGNEAAGQGGAIYCGIGSKLNGESITVSNNNAAGAAVYLNGAEAILDAAEITGNVNSVDGGSALHIANGSTARLNDCTIIGNSSPNRTEYCGGVYVPNNRSTLTISGHIVIDGNTVGGTSKEANIFLQNEGVKLVVGQLSKDSSIGITTLKTYTAREDPDAFMEKAESVTQWDPAWDKQWVVYENTLMNVSHSEKENFFFVAITDHMHCVCDNTGAAGCDHSKEAWLPWNEADRLPTNSGNYYLTKNVSLHTAVSLKGEADVKLCLNGKTISVKEESEISSVYQLFDGAVLTISDCTAAAGKAGKITGAERSAIWLEAGEAKLNLYAGIITGNHSTASGGAIRLNGDSTFNMYGGEISDNSGISAGALYVNNNSVVNVYGGVIKNNAARNNEEKSAGFGGAMLLVRGGELNLRGGSIVGNTAVSGGAVYATGEAKVNAIGGKLCENIAEVSGGAIAAIESSSVTVTGGTMEGNKAKTENGGAIFAEKATVKVSAGTIAGNTAKTGGGLYIGFKAALEMSGGEVSKNSATENGGGIQLYACTAKFTGGKVTENASKANGGGICTSQKCEVALDGLTVTGNTAAESGGGVLIQGYESVLNFVSGTVAKNKAKMGGGIFASTNTTLNMSGGEVSANEATKSGGGIQQYASTANYTGGTVKNNVSKANGGGICTSEKCKVKLSGTTVTQNTAAEFGGGFLLQGYGSVLNYSSGIVSGNKAKSGGGLFISANTTLNMTGGEVSKNSVTETGGGIQMYVGTANYSGGSIKNNTAGKNGGGLCTSQKCLVNLRGTTIRGNKAAEAAGGILLQGYGSVMNFSSGVVESNAAQIGGGMYISTNTTLNMSGGTVRDNTAENTGGGIQQLLSKANYTGGAIENNTAKVNGGGLCTSQKCEVVIDGIKITGNSAEEAGGGVVFQGYDGTLRLISGEISGNTATLGAGLFGSVNTVLSIEGGSVFDNVAKEDGGGLYLYYTTATVSGGAVHDNAAGANGGGVFSDHSTVEMSKFTVEKNKADANGGGIYTGQMDNFQLKNVTVTDNTAKESGGGLYLGIGSTTKLENVTVTDNEAKALGGALYAIDDLTMAGLTATDNKSGKGGAVYLDKANFDGRSYFAGLMIMSGDMRICDNKGPADMFIDEGTTVSVGSEGLGKDTKVCVTLASGVLTNTVFGAYDYEGGDCEYVITYGDRSLYELEQVEVPVREDEPETEPTVETPEEEEKKPMGVLAAVVAGIGVLAVVVAILIFLIWKRRKSQGTNR